MKSLPISFETESNKHWVVSKTRFSCMPLDQVHKQEYAKMKSRVGGIGF